MFGILLFSYKAPELLQAFFEVAFGQGHANNDAFQKKVFMLFG